MNIAYITTEFVTEENSFDGGLANYLYKISRTLKDLGHNPVIIVKSDRSERLVFDGITVYRVKINLGNWGYKLFKFILRTTNAFDCIYISYHLNKALNQIHKIEKFDIVQYSSFKATALFCNNKIPSVIRISSFHPDNVEARGIKKGSREDKLTFRYEIKAISKVDKIFGPSKLVASKFMKHINKDIQIIETLFSPENTKNQDCSLYEKYLNNKKYLLFFGKISKNKGAGLIADIIFDLLDKHKDLYFAFAGRDAGYATIIKNNAGIHSDKLIFLGRLKRNELNCIIKNSYCCILPSLADNFPNTAIEAMSHGKIVIGTEGSGFEQLIDADKNGFLIKDFNSADLMEKILKVLNLEPKEKHLIEQKAKERITKLDPKLIAKQTIDLYNSTIKNFQNEKLNKTL